MYNEPEQPAQSHFWSDCLEEIGRSRSKTDFMRFYDHFAPRLQSWLLGLTRDPGLAEELVQETMISVWRKAAKYDKSKAAASTWVFRIARNLHIDHLRRLQVRERSKAMLVDDDTTFDDQTVDRDRIHAAINQLPVQQAQVLYKSYFEGKSHQEIANELELPLGSVKSSLRLAFQKVCKALRP